jgi:hypothetical protein
VLKESFIYILCHKTDSFFDMELHHSLNPKTMKCYLYLRFINNEDFIRYYLYGAYKAKKSTNFYYQVFYKHRAKNAESMIYCDKGSTWELV